MSEDRKALQRELRETFRRVSEVLFRDWDPIGVNDYAPPDEYDAYVWPIVRILMGTRDEAEICEYLRGAGTETMGLGADRKARSRRRRVARKLLSL